MASQEVTAGQQILERADALRPTLEASFRDRIVEAIYAEAEAIASRVVHRADERRFDLDLRVDRVVTSRVWGLPLMGLLLAGVFWVTIKGANVPSALLASALLGVEDAAAGLFDRLGAPAWLTGFVWHGVYRGLAWVVSVKLPP
ncbi:MAG: ferrous iron transporter B, partial [Armatimonadetes bacterium]|nr:ferrous iron transporter B [Armatimonadota bacterium]